MKRFLIGVLIGLFLGWVTVPVAKATYSVIQSDAAAKNIVEDEPDLREAHAYKWYLTQMLRYMISMDQKLGKLNDTMTAIKEKLHA
jgi:hypothetical protein